MIEYINREKRQISHVDVFQIICGHSALKDGRAASHFLTVGFRIVTSFLKEKKISFRVEKTGKHYLSQWRKSVRTVVSPACRLYVPLMWWDENDPFPLWLPSPDPWLQSSHEKNMRSRGTPQSVWPVLLKAVKVTRNEETPRNCHNQGWPH